MDVTIKTAVPFVVSGPISSGGKGTKGGSGNGYGAFRGEKHEPRINRLLSLFSRWQTLTYLTAFGGDWAKDFAAGKAVTLPDGSVVSKDAPNTLVCASCADYHGKARKESTEPDPAGLSNNALFLTAEGKIVSLSVSCIGHYFSNEADNQGRKGANIAQRAGNGDVRNAIKNLGLFASHFPSNALSKQYHAARNADNDRQNQAAAKAAPKGK